MVLLRRRSEGGHTLLHERAEGLREADRRIRGGEEDGSEQIAAATHPDGPGSAAAPGGARITDLSHIPPLGPLVDAARRRELTDEDLTTALRGFERRYGPYHVREVEARFEEAWVQRDGREQPDNIELIAYIYDDNGDYAGELLYRFWRDNDDRLVVTNGITELEEGFRGRGFSTSFSLSTENCFRRHGVDRITVETGLEDGGVTWAKAGYGWDLDPRNLAESAANIRARIDSLITDPEKPPSASDTALLADITERFAGPAAEFPSPQELLALAGDNPKLGEDLLRGTQWYGAKKL